MKYNKIRRATRCVKIGSVTVGGNSPIAIQSMTNTDTHDYEATLAQVKALKAASCDVLRLTVPDMAAAEVMYRLKNADVGLPLVADIHYDYRVAVRCAEVGVDKIRINPGNIGGEERVRAVVDACKAHCVPIRIGVNTGSLPKDLVAEKGVTADAMVEAALRHVRILEDCGFYDIALSLKASDVRLNVEAYRKPRKDYVHF